MNRTKVGILFVALAALTLFGSCSDDDKGQDVVDLNKSATIVRDKESKNAQLNINFAGEWALYGANNVNDINLQEPILKGEGKGEYLLDVPTNVHYHFMLQTATSRAVIAERHLPMAGGYNFRDLGGIKTKDGRYTQWGKLFRSDELKKLTDADLAYLSSIPLNTIVDFRTDKEVSSAADKKPSSVKQNLHLPIEPGNLSDWEAMAQMVGATEEEMEQYMIDLNQLLAKDVGATEQYREFFKLLQTDSKIPLLFHCTAGKDRTGMGTALILWALGVDEDTIIKDYLLSNEYLDEKYAVYKEKYPQFIPLIEVRAKYLQAGLDKIKEEYGSVDSYLVDVLQVDIAKMKQTFLY